MAACKEVQQSGSPIAIFNASVTSSLSSLATHVSPYVSRGYIEVVHSSGGCFIFRIINHLKTYGVVVFSVPCVPEVTASCVGENAVVISFKNTAAGGLVRPFDLFFSEQLLSACVSYYSEHKNDGDAKCLLTVNMTFLENAARLSFDVPLIATPISIPQLRGLMVATLAVMPQTCNMLQRWLRAVIVGPESGVVLTMKEGDCVADLRSECQVKTLRFDDIKRMHLDCTANAARQRDHGCCVQDVVVSVSGDVLVSALSACRIHGVAIPVLRLYSGGDMEVVAIPIKKGEMKPARLHVVVPGTSSEVN